MHIHLSPRLAACADLVPQGSRVADVGCDHGYLSIHLLQTGRASHIYASDINEAPLRSAIGNSEKYGCREKMQFYLSDGVRNIPRDFDCMVCAGMGADTILSILESAPWLRSGRYSLVLQCQSKTPLLRQFLSQAGWRLHREIVIRDGRFLYTVMLARWEPGAPTLTPGQWYFPPALQEDPSPLNAEYFRYTLQGLRIKVSHTDDAQLHQALQELQALATAEPHFLKD